MALAHLPVKEPLLSGEGLMDLMGQSGQTCLTVLCPMHPTNPDRSSDRLALKHLIQEAALLIPKNWQAPVSENLLHQLEEIQDQVDLVHPLKGLAIYLNPNFQRVDHYSFTTPPEVMIDQRFPIREVIWQMQLSRPIYVISISEQLLRLEEVQNGNWVEIKDDFFPHPLRDDFEYSKPIRSSSYAGHAHVKMFERDKIEMQHTRLRDAFRASEHPLRPYLVNGEPLVLAGTERDVSLFRQVSKYENQVIAHVYGNYQIAHPELYRDKVIHAVHEHQLSQMQKYVSDFFEKWGSGLARCGISDCWNAIQAGQGLQLIVERGYREGWYVSPSGQFSKIRTADGSIWMPDAVDQLMEATIRKGGSVMLVDNNLLSSAQRIALILRYPTVIPT